MDAYEATRIVFSRIQNMDPDNASKIMGLLLIQDHGEKEMIRLAFGPESLVHSVILKSRKELGLLSNTSSTPSSPSPFHLHPLSLSRQNSSPSSRLIGVGGGSFNLPSPLSIPNPSSFSSAASSWGFSDFHGGRDDLISPSTTNTNSATAYPTSSSAAAIGSSTPSSMNSSAPPFYASGIGIGGGGGVGSDVMIDEFHLQDQLSFLNDGSPTLGPKNPPDIFYPQADLASSSPTGELYGGGNWGGPGNSLSHRRSCSVSDICVGSEDGMGGVCGWKPCLYFARGYCKNGTSCRFLHGGGDGMVIGSPNSNSKIEMMEQCHELLRSKQQQQQQQQQRLLAASQLIMSPSSSSSFPYSPTSKSINFLLQQQQQQQQTDGQRAAAALMLGEDMHKFARIRMERNEFSMNGMVNPGSRQIYLTFPADSTFREEDVSNYFSIYGPVQDVRIPYQQKRMFGFVTFVYSETVKLILAKGNPHFVCDARVLVKPYKEKGKVPDKYRKHQQQQPQPQMDGEFSSCGSPTGLEPRDPFDLPLGPRMFYNNHDMLWRKKLEEQAELQQAIELQGQRLMDLQLLNVKRQHHHRALSTGAAIPSPRNFFNQQPFVIPSLDHRTNSEILEENGFIAASPTTKVQTAAAAAANFTSEIDKIAYTTTENGNGNGSGSNSNSNSSKGSPHSEASDLPESSLLEHNLPDSPFASPKACGGEYRMTTAFANAAAGLQGSVPSSTNTSNIVMNSTLLPATSTLDMASFKSCFFQAPPRFSSGHGAIEM